MDIGVIEAKLRERVPEGVVELQTEPYSPHIVVHAGKIRDVCLFLRDELGFDYLTHMSGVDRGERFAVVYRVLTLSKKRTVSLRAYVPRAEPELDTVSDIWASAGWFEREAYDLFGIRFLGHYDLRRLLLPEDFVGHPLRKDYVDPYRYRDIDNTRIYWEE